MKYFFDTEFIEYPGHLDLISIGMVSEDNRKLHYVSYEFNALNANDWVKENVIKKLPPSKNWVSRTQIKNAILEFVDDDRPQFWAYFAAYDWVAFCQIFGSMIDLPKGWPMFCMDLKQVMTMNNFMSSNLPPKPVNEHDALADAKWLKKAHKIVINVGAGFQHKDDRYH